MAVKSVFLQAVAVLVVMHSLLIPGTECDTNMICQFMPKEIIKQLVMHSLGDVRASDPLQLDDMPESGLTDGLLQGLHTLTNVSQLYLSCDDDKVVFRVTLGIRNVNASFHWIWQFFSGTITMTAREVRFQLEVTAKLEREVRFHVTNSLVTSMDGFRFRLTGLGPFNAVVGVASRLVYAFFSTRVCAGLSRMIRSALERELAKLPHIDF